MKTVSVIFGTRPEAIKMAPVIRKLKARAGLRCHVCVTAQHRQMLDQVLEVFGIVPDADLDLMRPGQTLAGLTARAVEALDAYLAREKPDLVLAQGDTTTVLCAALAAFYHHIPFGHVEAGLRTGDLQSPWPEEANRVLASRLTGLHFAPTAAARENLLREGVSASCVHVTGNPVIDALFLAREKVLAAPPPVPGLPDRDLAAFGDRRTVLITGHRRESFGAGFEAICYAIRDLAERFPDVEFVYPVHLNPNVREPAMRILGPRASCPRPDPGDPGADKTAALQPGAARMAALHNIHLLEPLSYLPFIHLMARAYLLLTDSGGVQEEGPSLGKPVLVMRDTTERPEAVEAGTVRLVGTDRDRIVQEVTRLLTDEPAYQSMSRAHNPYGDGRAAERIVALCAAFLEQ